MGSCHLSPTSVHDTFLTSLPSSTASSPSAPTHWRTCLQPVHYCVTLTLL